MTLAYPIASNAAHPARLSPAYRSTLKRAPSKPLIIMRHTLSELTGPVYGHETVRENDSDLTTQHAGEPLGERIIVHGHVLDEDGRGVPNTLVELWQANACGRYIHVVDQHPAPLDPNFTGAGRAQTDSAGYYKFITIKPGAYPWGNHHNARSEEHTSELQSLRHLVCRLLLEKKKNSQHHAKLSHFILQRRNAVHSNSRFCNFSESESCSAT